MAIFKQISVRDLARRIVFILNDDEYIKDERERAVRVSQKIQGINKTTFLF